MTTKNILKALAATAMTAALLGCNKNEPENPDGPASKPLPDEISLQNSLQRHRATKQK